ncbi:purine-nucleoside phosphorylase [Kinneretia asaccharophila]|jgi:inosine/guanosine/xanthosine phosphorylase family protein|uniref:Purine nucleoside phosphorylase n=1 Tax=Roseateles asaccharophilus TaxID=582607 RepID=A0A4R6N9S8_9BURK|nr:purine-nucleoside phosphorylase [Roseateles asaccharophilus]MDN3543454.1 purine-nucleoside phosphorylase [Roseateles asaccharophilus]TDP12168.1 purine-nucleoside phosphorylase [Roseateles asaccharophilus]
MIDHKTLNPRIDATVEKLNSLFGAAPEVAVVLGSGWAGAVSHVEDAQQLSYAELPAFPQPKVEGHVSEIVVGRIGAQRVVMLRGRAHTYESGDCTGMAGALRSLKRWGVKALLQTNASGSLRTHMPPGSLMLISDHINAPQRSPLVGEPGSERFVDMSSAYDVELRSLAKQIAKANNQIVGEGVYVWALGPQFETPAEIRMFAAWGADAVGMSTVPETILARHAGLRVMGLALMTNMAAGLSAEALTHALTLQQAQASGERAAAFLARVVAGLAELPSLRA